MLSMKVIRPGSAPPAILFTTAPVTILNAGDVVSVDVRVPVEQGDTLGFWLGNAGICATPGLAGDGIAGVLASADQPAGPISGMLFGDFGSRLAVGARWEPDADGDQFGDDTQDDCPTDPSITTGGCRTDAVLTAVATPASIELGDVAVIDLSVANPGTGRSARGAALTGVLPAGLRPCSSRLAPARSPGRSRACSATSAPARARPRWSSAAPRSGLTPFPSV